jgi:chorismate mutase
MIVIVRIIVPLAAALTLVTAAPAHAEPPSPLHRLVDTAAQRLETADAVAAYKWINGGPITDVPRARQVLDDVAANADAHGVDAGYVRAQFQNQIDATEGIEYIRFGQWKFNPAAAPGHAPDLTESRTAIDGFNKTMVDEIALQWGTLHGPGCAAALTEATTAVAAERHLDQLYQDGLTAATRSYCS